MSRKGHHVHTASPPAPEISHNLPANQELLCPLMQSKSPAAHGTLLRAHATTGLSYQINVILAANAYACNHLPTGLYVHAAPTQGQQGGASQNTQNKGRSPALPVQQRQISLRGQLRQRRQPR